MSKATALSWREVFGDLLSLNNVIYVPELAGGDFDEDFRPGLVHGLFVKRDERLVGKIFETLSSQLDSRDFRDQVVALYRRGLEREVRKLRTNLAQSEGRNPIAVEMIRDHESRILSASWENLVSHYGGFYEASWDWHRPDVANDNFFRDKYLLFSIATLLFEHLSQYDSGRFVVPQDSLLASEYANAGVDLFQIDAQFSSYGLLTVVKEMSFSDVKPLEPFDSRVEKHLTVDSEALTVLDLVALEKRGVIGTLSFRPRFNVGLRSVNSLNISMEEVERGTLFDLSNLDKPEITKLYSADYDTLWIKIKVGDITFEEMVQDFVIEGDYIVTQVVHLQHSKKNGVDLINHIDHEYIYYTLDEYETRKINPDQKGEARTRIKTFKVDYAAIPFTLPDGRWFLYLILERHFQNSELIREYFQKVL